MKTTILRMKRTLVIVLLSTALFSYSQNKIVELPLVRQNGFGPFGMAYAQMSPLSESENDPWKKTYLKVSKFPEGLTDIKYGNIETNIYQSVYQDYLLGNITEAWYEELQLSWNWEPDTLSLSRTPVKTKIAFAYGKDSEGNIKVAIDANDNLDLSDDRLAIPPEITYIYNSSNRDSLVQAHSVNVYIEDFVQKEIVSVSVPLLVVYNSRFDMLMWNFPQYATTEFKGEQIAVFGSSTNLSYKNIQVALLSNHSKDEDVYIYKENEPIEIKDEIYKILGVNTDNHTLTLEKIDKENMVTSRKIDLPEAQMFSTQEGDKPYPFQGKEFTTDAIISLEGLKGKYVLLDFFATWCLPCIQEIPNLKELYSKIDTTKFEIVGIVGSSPPGALKRLIDRHSIAWPQIMSDETNRIIEIYGINSYPTTMLLDTEGVIIAKNLKGKELEEKVLGLIKK